MAVGIAVASVAYLATWRQTRARAGPSAASGRRFASFVAAMVVVAAASFSPVARLGEQLLLVHVSQHALLLDVAALLLILSMSPQMLEPIRQGARALPRRLRTVAGEPAIAVVAYAGSLWLWHIPALYNAALRGPALHVLQHATFLAAGTLFWWHVVSPLGLHRRLQGLGVGAYTASAKFLTGVLASSIAFSALGAYEFYPQGDRIWSLDADLDQQLGGGVMIVEELVAIGAALAYLFIRMLSESDRDDGDA